MDEDTNTNTTPITADSYYGEDDVMPTDEDLNLDFLDADEEEVPETDGEAENEKEEEEAPKTEQEFV